MTADGSPTPTVRRRPLAALGEVPLPVASVGSIAPGANPVVRGLESSRMFGLAVRVYRSHERDSAGRCRSCPGRMCRTRAHAAAIIAAAGVDPAAFDAGPRCGVTGPTIAGGRSPLWGNGARVVRSRLAPVSRGRTRLVPRSAGTRREWPHSRDVAVAVRPARVSTATTVSVHSELVHLARSSNPYPLCGLLFCRCGVAFRPWGSPEAKREYMAWCGCRLRPVDAGAIERRVYADAARLRPDGVTDGGAHPDVEVLTGLYARIEVGGMVDDVRFVPRT